MGTDTEPRDPAGVLSRMATLLANGVVLQVEPTSLSTRLMPWSGTGTWCGSFIAELLKGCAQGVSNAEPS